ncbi:hypothetical protein BDF22DRAFT_449273 [Syncephalis plumigaleata]|nr:hypothetical protein BDF22DRAFT_449273 [Syncephalis plumigaleata]
MTYDLYYRMANDWGREQLRHCSRILDTSNNDDNDHHHNDTMAIVQACASGTRPFVLATAEHMAHSIGVMMTTMEQQIEITLDNQERLWTYIETYCLPLLSIPEAYPIIEQLLYSVCKRQPRSSSGMSTNETNVTLSNRLVMWLSIEHLDIFCKLSFHCQNTVYYYYPNLLKEQMAKCASALVVSPSSSSSLMTLTQLRVLLSHWPLWCLCRKYPNLLEQSMLVWCQLVIEFPDWQLVRIARCWIRLSLLALKDQSSSSSWMNSKQQQQPFGELLMTCQSLAIQLQRIEHIRKHGAGYVEQELHDELFEKIRQALITIPAMVYDHYHPPPPPTLANTLVWLLLGAWPTWHITSTTSVNDGYTRTVAWMLVPTGIPMAAPSSNLQATTRQLIRDVAQFVQRKYRLSESIG